MRTPTYFAGRYTCSRFTQPRRRGRDRQQPFAVACCATRVIVVLTFRQSPGVPCENRIGAVQCRLILLLPGLAGAHAWLRHAPDIDRFRQRHLTSRSFVANADRGPGNGAGLTGMILQE